MTGLMTFSMISLSICLLVTSGLCCVETTIVSTRTGLPFRYSTVTWDLPSGRTHGRIFFLRTSARRLCEPMGQDNRHRHQFGGFIGGIAEHETLVASAAGIHSHGDIAGLLMDGGKDRAGVEIKSPRGVGIARHP